MSERSREFWLVLLAAPLAIMAALPLYVLLTLLMADRSPPGRARSGKG